MSREFKVRDVKQRIYEEAKNEFKAKLGDNVESTQKNNNSEALSATMKKVEDYLKQMDHEEPKVSKAAAGGENRGMDSLLYDRVGESFKDRVDAQLRGFDSELNEKEHGKEELGNATRGSKEDVKVGKEKADAVKKDKDTLKTNGLVSRTADKTEVEKQTSTVYESSEPYSRLRFKHTRFLSEGDVKKHIPDNYKVEGRKFYMNDNQGNEFLVEWSNGVGNILSHDNVNLVNEKFERIRNLMKYDNKAGYERTTNVLRENADNSVRTLLEKTRQMGAN